MLENEISLDDAIRTALEEDLGPGDLTTDAIIAPESQARASLLAREALVLAGIQVFSRVFKLLSAETVFEYFFSDGQSVPAGETICIISGPARAILKAERTALNFLQRMSGIATLTKIYVDKVGSDRVRVVDTRKTAPGLRLFDKYAVRMGGGFNHRMGLFDGILIKDNHIMAAGSVAKAVRLAKGGAPHTIKVEVEVEDLDGVEEALQAGADVILLDNMPSDMIQKAVDLVGGRATTEASGGITLENIEEIAKTGVDIISVGALTHSLRAVDLSMEIVG
ncbi:carboxylating nicotinate-nucleotide diphosphorylase [bacterium]|nr:carboxylating nicotinate-nucleotide diphosphorylase [bacterium]